MSANAGRIVRRFMELKALRASKVSRLHPCWYARVARAAINSVPPATATPYCPSGSKCWEMDGPYCLQKVPPMMRRSKSPQATGRALMPMAERVAEECKIQKLAGRWWPSKIKRER